MSGIIKSLMVKVGVDLDEMQKGFKQAGKEMKAVGKNFTDTGRSMTMGLTLPLVGAAVAAVKYASDTEESLNKVRVAFKESAGQVEDFAKTSLDSFGIAEGTALDMAATYGDMGTAMGLATGKAADMATSLTGLAGDLASFKNIGIDQASDALRGIFTGEGEALKTLGIVMQESTLEAYALSKGMDKTYKSMSQAEKVALRYEFVMSATANAQGDFKRTGGGVANQLRVVQEGLKQAAAALGKELLPAIANVLKEVNKAIKSFTNMDDGTKKLIIQIGLLVAAIGPTLSVVGKMTTGMSGLFTGISKAAGVIKGGGGLISALTAVIGPAGLAVIAIAAIGAAIIAINNDESRKALQQVKNLTKDVSESTTKYESNSREIAANSAEAKKLVDELYDLEKVQGKSAEQMGRMQVLVTQLNTLMPELNLSLNKQTYELNLQKASVKTLIAEKQKELMFRANEERLLELYKTRTTITEELKRAQQRLTLATEDAKNSWDEETVSTLWAKNEFKDAKEQVDLLTKSLNKIDDSIDGVSEDMYKAGEAVGDGFANGIKSKIQAIREVAGDMAKVIPYSVRRILEIESPSKVLSGIGGFVSEGFAQGIAGNTGMVERASADMASSAVPDVSVGSFNATGRSGGQGKGDTIVIQVGGKTILDTVITEQMRRQARAGRIAVGV